MTRNGKIARLPEIIRNQLNRRLRDGEPGVRLVPWLNALPEVQAMLARDFGGEPIKVQNMSAWKTGGYLEWLQAQEEQGKLRDFIEDAKDLRRVTGNHFADDLAMMMSARYARVLANWNHEPIEKLDPQVRSLNRLCQAVLGLRQSVQPVSGRTGSFQPLAAFKPNQGESR